jgi:hypothetical protein
LVLKRERLPGDISKSGVVDRLVHIRGIPKWGCSAGSDIRRCPKPHQVVDTTARHLDPFVKEFCCLKSDT